MDKSIKICTWNVCLGAKSKIQLIKEQLMKEKIDILCIQEAEVKQDDDESDFAISGYAMEFEKARDVKRTIIYVSEAIEYKRLHNKEVEDSHIIVLEVSGNSNTLTLASIYRTFKLTRHQNHQSALTEQINILKELSAADSLLILGDINLDASRKHDPSYNLHALYETWSEMENEMHLCQLVKEYTWARPHQGQLRKSILDHVYTNNITLVSDIKVLSVSIGDHCPVVVTMDNIVQKVEKYVNYRNWRGYSKEKLNSELAKVNWEIGATGVQDFNDELEQKIMTVLNELVPFEMKRIKSNNYSEPENLSKLKKKRSNLFRNAKRRNSSRLIIKCRKMDKRIRFLDEKHRKQKIRSNIKAGDQKSLWDAVRMSQDKAGTAIPRIINHDGKTAENDQSKSDLFAEYFSAKVEKISSECAVADDVYNGEQKETSENVPFFVLENVIRIMKKLKDKKSYGFDNIPVKVLRDGVRWLARPIFNLLQKIYGQKTFPEQWKTSRIIPLHKKGSKSEVSNYRPISNLCSVTKIFEKLMLQRLSELEERMGDLTGTNQHGFKPGRSTVTACQQLQSRISRSMDQGEYVAMGSLDLTAAFDVVNIELLIKRLRIKGLPEDFVCLVEEWLANRLAYVEVADKCSPYFEVKVGTCQGSCMGPVLFGMFISPLLEQEDLVAYADDTYGQQHGKDKKVVVKQLQEQLNKLMKWFKASGLKINEDKTEFIVFYHRDVTQVTINLSGKEIKSSQKIKVLGILFDSKMDWSATVEKTVKSARKACQGVRMIRRYFDENERISLITSLVYSKMYYAAQVWLLPTLKKSLIDKLYSMSGAALKLVAPSLNYKELHKKYERATPLIFSRYLTAVNFFDVSKSKNPQVDFHELPNVLTRERRNPMITFVTKNALKCGNNLIHNRFKWISNMLKKDCLSMSKDCYKTYCKSAIIKKLLSDW